MLKISDVIEFFTSFQGEGPKQGKLATFLRLRKCNLKCNFCDTISKMKTSSPFILTYDEILEHMENNNCNYLVITGGEPTLYNENLLNLITSKIFQNKIIGIETNGYKLPQLIEDLQYEENTNIDFYLSPKLFEESSYKQFLEKICSVFSYYIINNNNLNLYLKFVNFNSRLIDQQIKYVINLGFPRENIYVMPQGRSSTELLLNSPETCDIVLNNQVNLSSRLHILGLVP